MPNSLPDRPIIIATRGSALALTQARYVQDRLQKALPEGQFEIQIFKTTGDALQSRPADQIPKELPKGLFTKELESALLDGRADLAVHSLKDLPTELPEGLGLAAVSPREDAREMLLTKSALNGTSSESSGNPLKQLPDSATIATGSPRRQAFVNQANPTLRTVEIRGNVPTRIRKLAENPELDGIILAIAGLNRLGYQCLPNQPIVGEDLPPNIYTHPVAINAMIPCVGQAAIGLETRSGDETIHPVCQAFNDPDTEICVTAERVFLAAMGGGCQTPVAGHAILEGDEIVLTVAQPVGDRVQSLTDRCPRNEGPDLAKALAARLKKAAT